MDDELKELAALVLRNAFWRDFSTLANLYLGAAEGLDQDDQERQMGDLTSIYGRDSNAVGERDLQIWALTSGGRVKPHKTILGALAETSAVQVSLNGRTAFERRKGEWHITDI